MGKFVIKTGKNGKYYFSLNAGNGETILSGQGYSTKTSCKRGIASVKKNGGDASRFVKAVSKNGKSYFTLTAANKMVIGKSEMYESDKACNNGIASVRKNAPGATVTG